MVLFEIQRIIRKTHPREVLPHIFLHLWDTHGVVGMDNDVPDLKIIFLHVDRYVITGLDFSKVIVQTDVADFTEHTEHVCAAVVVANHVTGDVVWDMAAVIRNDFCMFLCIQISTSP